MHVLPRWRNSEADLNHILSGHAYKCIPIDFHKWAHSFLFQREQSENQSIGMSHKERVSGELAWKLAIPGRVAWNGQTCSRRSRVQNGHCDSVNIVTFTCCDWQPINATASVKASKLLENRAIWKLTNNEKGNQKEFKCRISAHPAHFFTQVRGLGLTTFFWSENSGLQKGSQKRSTRTGTWDKG